MKLLAFLLLTTALPSTAFAQHAGHTAAGDEGQSPAADPHAGHSTPPRAAVAPDPACPPEHAAMGHCTPKPDQAAPAAPGEVRQPVTPVVPAGQDAACPAEHATMGHCTPRKAPAPVAPEADPHAGHQMPAAPGSAATDPHAGHQMGAAPSIDPRVGPPPAAAFLGPENAADLFWSPQDMQRSKRKLSREHGGLTAYKVFVDRLEAKLGRGADTYAADVQAWYGGDTDKLWLKADVDGEFGGSFDGAQLQALWSHAITPWFDLQTGVRYDAKRGPDRVHFVLGVQGLAPYWIELDAAAFVSDRGDVTAHIEAEHDIRITQKLVLQPRAEVEFAFQDIPDKGIGSGLSSAAIGLRLRYELSPQFAPYVGFEYTRAFGDTRRFREAAGEKAGRAAAVGGVRIWF